jgi:hypothetical protein
MTGRLGVVGNMHERIVGVLDALESINAINDAQIAWNRVKIA